MIGWLYTGPLGHLVAGVLDWVTLVARYALSRVRTISDGYADRDGPPT